MKKIVSILTTIIMVFSLAVVCSVNTAAASGRSSMSFSKKQVNVGESVTVTVNISADENIYATEFKLTYDSDVLEFVSGDDCSGGAGVISVVATGDSKSVSLKYSFKAKKAGSCYISTSGMTCSGLETDEIKVANQGANLTVKDVSLSNNANLKSLSLSDGTLYPAFSSGRTSYSAEVGNDVTSCKIYATASDNDARVSISGNSGLDVGNNTCYVTVTAPNGTQKTYKIVIKRSEDQLSSSEDATSSEEPVEEDPLETEVDGKNYIVMQDISDITLPKGFKANRAEFNGEEVAIATDENNNYAIYYLISDDKKSPQPYTLDIETNTFNKLEYLKQAENFYIFSEMPEGFNAPKGFYITTAEIGGNSVNCYTSSSPEFSSFYFLYCFNGEDYGFYRYDTMEDVMQRYPEMKISDMALAEEETEETGFIAKFSALSTNAKIIVLGMVVVILLLISVIVLFFLRLISQRQTAAIGSNIDYVEGFDNVEYQSGFSLEETEKFLTEETEYEPEDTADELEEPPLEVEADYLTEEDEEESEEVL